jgi:hypothetical protein
LTIVMNDVMISGLVGIISNGTAMLGQLPCVCVRRISP